MTYLEQLNELLDDLSRGWHTDEDGPREETDEEFYARLARKAGRPTGQAPPALLPSAPDARNRSMQR